MNTTEINGFEIDSFNQYDLQVGKKEGICPLCSHDRKPENRKAKCAMYAWERGLGTCMNCDNVFQLHTFKRKGGGDKDYVLPEWKNNTQLSDNAMPKKILDAMHSLYDIDPELLPFDTYDL